MDGVTEPEQLQDRTYYKIGEFVYDNAKVVLVVTMLACVGFASLMLLEPQYVEGFGEGDLESVHGWNALGEGFSDGESGNVEIFYVLFHHPGLNVSNPNVQNAMIETVQSFAEHDGVDVNYPWNTNEENQSYLISEVDDSWSRVEVRVNLDRDEAKALLADEYDDILLPSDAPEGMQKWVTGNLAIDVTFDMTLKKELIEAELISGPITLIILLLIFGSLIAAGLPVMTGVYTVISAVGIVTGLTYIFDDITIYANNIVSLLGIGLSVDYSLFIVNRFREELRRGHDHRTAIAMTSATAGRAILFSGLTVIAGLSGMLVFQNTSLPSLGWGGICATFVALTSSIVLLPALLSLLGDRVNSIKIPFSFNDKTGEDGFWSWIANRVMKRPLVVLIPSMMVLLIAGSPFLQAEWGLTSWRALSPDDEARRGLELTDEKWVQDVSNTATLVFEVDTDSDLFSEQNLRDLHALSKEILEVDNTMYVYSFAHFDAEMSADQVVDFWDESGDGNLTQQEQVMIQLQRNGLIESTVGNDVVIMVVGISGEQSSEESREVVKQIRSIESRNNQFGGAAVVNIAGFAAYNQDVLDAVIDGLPVALGFILVASYVLIFLQVRSVILPLKAIVMNILSVSASFGVLVWVFQMGNGAELMNFTPQPIDPTTPVMIFAILYGLSMDYEVLMLSRIHEEWERTGDNNKAVAVGLQKSGRIITSAALVMITVFSAFGISSISLMKQFGLMLALGVAVDATIVRALVVPATMRLMGDLNWWTPKWLGGEDTTQTIVKVAPMPTLEQD
ncbi:MAG TPA: MMPL family transporter [Candidatus Thalassarchaeaceae archaeon]|nr:MMPL family transporter [Candidatus Thalassarchaeaceae archaeon]|tara:strand:+ start:2097 stop:4466 length:2370 start_codon:yes stop_codon:yes gene_type:complete